MSDAWTIRRLLDWTADYLKTNGSDTPRLDAEVLLADVRNCQRIMLYTAYDEVASDEVRSRFRELVRRRAEGAPVAYLVGHREFFSLDFSVNEHVLVPRPETEYVVTTLVDLAKEKNQANLKILDIGTGSGVLAVCAAKHIPTASIVAVDLSANALDVARKNVDKHQVKDKVELVQSDLFECLPANAKFDFIVSNPPYIAVADPSVDANVAKHEPAVALFAGEDGLDVIRRIIEAAPEYLVAGGSLIMEIGDSQYDSVAALIHETGHFAEPSTVKDQAEIARVIVTRRL
ncbi:MAG: peptide chain release factor N(5)-glutamine methyltransferase [Planctomycetales bacterium]|nr:peptide chain release factor N(5)-glutamine methyltransferase [Planctomycetales bacterium]